MKHHPWCYFRTCKPSKCKMCQKLLKDYPIVEDMMETYFPDENKSMKIECKNCNKRFPMRKTRGKLAQFCSAKCFGAWQKEHPLTNDHYLMGYYGWIENPYKPESEEYKLWEKGKEDKAIEMGGKCPDE